VKDLNMALELKDYNTTEGNAWCPGCGNFGILNALKKALVELNIEPKNLVISSGIGQAAKTPHYIKCNFFNGLHGRALPPATAIKAVNPSLTVIAESGDGCSYGEGGNHFIHTVRRNPDITHIVHNNMVYGLTKGQASPTSQLGFHTPVQVDGVSEEPFNPMAVAITLNASFVARCLASDIEKTKDIIKQAIMHKGYALVDILQACVSFNKVNTMQWYKDNSYYLPETYDPLNRQAALAAALSTEKLALGVLYRNPARPVFDNGLAAYRNDKQPLPFRALNRGGLLNKLLSQNA
jgi:2-oxoglutarate ferredoxin oxidoreductase subunit beta